MWSRSLLAVLAVAAPALAAADDIEVMEEGVTERTLEKDFGVGLAIGAASGPNFQFMTTEWTHITLGFGIGSITSTRFQGDFAWRAYYWARNRSLAIPLYIGAGAYFTDRRWGVDTGLRAPVGVQVEFAEVPIQIFGELAPEVSIYRNIMAGVEEPAEDPRMRVSLRGMLGVRATF